jgi:hypothetical protein
MQWGRKRTHTPFEIAFAPPADVDVDAVAGNDGTGTESDVPDTEGTRPIPTAAPPVPPTPIVLPVLRLFFNPSSAKALPATDDEEVDVLDDFVNLNNGTESRFRRFLEGVVVVVVVVVAVIQSEQMEGRIVETVALFMQYTHVAIVVVVPVETEAYMWVIQDPSR